MQRGAGHIVKTRFLGGFWGPNSAGFCYGLPARSVQAEIVFVGFEAARRRTKVLLEEGHQQLLRAGPRFRRVVLDGEIEQRLSTHFAAEFDAEFDGAAHETLERRRAHAFRVPPSSAATFDQLAPPARSWRARLVRL